MAIEDINPGFYYVMSKRQLKQFAAKIRTMYKRKDRKIRPVNIPLHPTWSTIVWEKIGIDVVHMLNSAGYGYIVFAWDDLSGWVEGRALARATSKNVAKFIYEEVICRHGCPKHIVMDQRALEEVRAAENLERSRKENKAYFNEHKRLHGDGELQLHVGDLVLLYPGRRQQS